MPLDFTTSNSPLDFIAREEPLYLKGEPINSHKAITRVNNQGNTELLGVVGRGYKLVQNRDLFRTVDTAISKYMTEDALSNVKIKDEISYGGAWCSRQYVFMNVRYDINVPNTHTIEEVTSVIALSYHTHSTVVVASRHSVVRLTPTAPTVW